MNAKHYILFLFALGSVLLSQAQYADLQFIARGGKIEVQLNGKKVNSTFSDTVRLNRVKDRYCSVLITYADTQLISGTWQLYPKQKFLTSYIVRPYGSELKLYWDTEIAVFYPDEIPTDTSGTDSASVAAEPESDIVLSPRDCTAPVDGTRFVDFLAKLRETDLDSDKLFESKKLLVSDCINSEQLRHIIGSFDLDETRLVFVKAAYPFVTDTENFSRVYDAFEYPDAILELEMFVKLQK